MGINGIDKNSIKMNIEELRESLNQICVMQECENMLKKRLILSQKLDQLIVAYMSKEKEN